MATGRHRRNPWAFAAIVFAGFVMWAVWRHNRNASAETRFSNLGAEVYFSRPLAGLSQRLAACRIQTVATYGAPIVDRLTGRIVAADFGRKYDVSAISPDAAVAELVAQPALEVIMIDGLTVGDSHLESLAALKSLRELGLRRTRVTAQGVASFKRRRPNVEVAFLAAAETAPP